MIYYMNSVKITDYRKLSGKRDCVAWRFVVLGDKKKNRY